MTIFYKVCVWVVRDDTATVRDSKRKSKKSRGKGQQKYCKGIYVGKKNEAVL